MADYNSAYTGEEIDASVGNSKTAADLKTAYESNADTNAFTDAEKAKLTGIETGADVTDVTNVTAAGAVMTNSNATLDSLKLNGGVSAEGTFAWNDQDGTVDLNLKGGNVTLQIGQEAVVRVVNGTGVNLLESEYKAVKVIGAQGQRLQVDFALANSDVNSATTIGIVTENIDNNQEGFITSSGVVRGINTTGSLQGETWTDGDVLYLSPTVEGALTNINPLTPYHLIVVGFVEYAHAVNGKIYVKVDNGYEIEELHDVLITSVADNELLQYNSAGGYWENQTLSEAGIATSDEIINLESTKQNNITLTTIGTSGASTLIGDTLNIPNYAVGGGAVDSVNGETGAVILTTGDINEDTDANYVTDAQLAVIGNTSGTNTGDQDISGIATNAGDITTIENSLASVTDFISGFIPAVADQSYKLIVKIPYAATITETTTISTTGTCTATFKINTTALGGTANSVSTSEQSQAHASANSVVIGDDIVLTISSNTSCQNVSFTIKYTRAI